MRSKGLWVSPSRDRASSYTAPPVLKCATASWAAPYSRGCHRTVAVVCPHLRISVARSTLAAWRTMRGGTGVLTSEDTFPVHPVCGPGAACSHSPVAASNGWAGPAPRITVGLGRVAGALPSSGMAVYRCAGVFEARVAAHQQLHSRAHSSPTMRASHGVMEPRPMIHGRKRASCRCFEKLPGRSWYGWGGRALQSAIHDTEGGYEVLVRARGRGRVVALRRVQPSVRPGRRA